MSKTPLSPTSAPTELAAATPSLVAAVVPTPTPAPETAPGPHEGGSYTRDAKGNLVLMSRTTANDEGAK